MNSENNYRTSDLQIKHNRLSGNEDGFGGMLDVEANQTVDKCVCGHGN